MEELKKDRIKNWLKDRNNFLLVSVIILIFILRFYYFIITLHQPVWWDESEYLSAAKNYAGIAPYELSSQRLPGYPLFVSAFYRLGVSNEMVLRFLLNFLPSIGVILLVYLCIKEMYPDKRVALISMIILAVLWEHLFYSNRFQTENFALIFQFLAFFILFRVYMKKKNAWFISPKYSLVWISIFSVISFLFRPGNLMFIPPMIIFILLLNKSKVFSKKLLPVWALLIILFAAFLFYLPNIPRTGLFSYYHPESPFAWNSLMIFKAFYVSLVQYIPSFLYYSFFAGLLVVLYELFLRWGMTKKLSVSDEGMENKANIFNLILLVFVMAYFIFILRASSYEYRWYFPFLTAMLAFTGKGITAFSDLIGGFFSNRKISSAIIIILVLLGAYTQLVHSNSIIKMKIDSYSQIRDASVFIKENTVPGDVVFSRSLPQTSYYSERKTYSYSEMNESQFIELAQNTRPKYMLESVLEPHPAAWGFNLPAQFQSILIPVKVFYLDSAQKEPVAVVYQFVNYTI